jgi:ketosteroid isomerase-like protein
MHEQNRELATRLFARFSENDVDGALAMLADDVNWWIAGRREQNPSAGDHTKEQIGRTLKRMAAQMPAGLTMTVRSMISDGDRVAAEVESHGTLLNGRVYNNEYHFALTFRDGRISEVREYLDTQHVFATWFQV